MTATAYSGDERSRFSASDIGLRFLLSVVTLALVWLADKGHDSWLESSQESGDAAMGSLLIWLALDVLVGIAAGYAMRAPLTRSHYNMARAVALGVLPLLLTIYFILFIGDIGSFKPNVFSGYGPQFMCNALLGLAIMSGFPRSD